MNAIKQSPAAGQPSEEQLRWISNNVERAWAFVAKYRKIKVPEALRHAPSIVDLDHALVAWRSQPELEREPAFRLGSAITAAFALHLATVGGHNLAMVQGQRGPELAVQGRGERLVRPVGLVADIISGKRPGWLIVAFAEALSALGEPQKSSTPRAPAPAKPRPALKVVSRARP